MFSFIKAIQNLLSELKKRKGLWFTILSVLSIFGISLSMYLLTTMTAKIAEEVYANMSINYKSNLEYKFEDKQKEFRKIVLGLKANDYFRNNLNNKQVIDSMKQTITSSIESLGGEVIFVEKGKDKYARFI